MNALGMIAVATSLLMTTASSGTINITGGWHFKPDPDAIGVEQGWANAEYDDHGWAVIDAGKRWEDQGFATVDGPAWYCRTVEIPEDWRDKPVWMVLGGVNDACTVFCNGRRVNAYGDETEHSVHATPLLVYLTPFITAGASNRIAIRCFDWGGSGGLWHSPCFLTNENENIPADSVLTAQMNGDQETLGVSMDLTPLGNDQPGKTLCLSVYAPTTEMPICEKTIELPGAENEFYMRFEHVRARPGEMIRMRMVLGADIPNAAMAIERNIAWPSPPQWPGRYNSLRVRNNFVTELCSGKTEPETSHTFDFINPRSGWVFVTVQMETGASDPVARLDTAPDSLIWRRNPDTGAQECMQQLIEGDHSIQIRTASLATFSIRTMPEIAFCYYPCSPHIAVYGPYDWAYMTRNILPHVNTLITRQPVPDSESTEWIREGRQWISNAGLPGLSGEQPPSSDEVYSEWVRNPAVSGSNFSGMIVDEFLTASEAHYQAWGDAVRRLHQTPEFSGKTFYAWCGDLFRDPAPLAFSRLLAEQGDRFSWERYLPEEASQERAVRSLAQSLTQHFAQWRKAMPGVEKHMVVCLGYLCAPPETVNTYPGVNYQVFLDMQFRLLATEPTFFGLYGLMEYMADYADEESMRFAHRLFRHYCIEGNTAPYISDPYILPHIKNPDFDLGLESWHVEAAEPGSVRADAMDGISWLEGRYPRTSQGNRFCGMRRSDKAPNRVSQRIRGLQPGRLYAVKLISADLSRLDEKQTSGLYVQVTGASARKEYDFQFPYPSCYSHEVEPYTKNHPAWFNFHRTVFCAESETAELIISDWTDAGMPGGRPGQDMAFHFVEVQPFYAP